MSSNNNLRYIKLDYASHRDAMLQRVRSRWPTLWNDFLANNFGRVLVDLVAWSTESLAFSINRLAAENFLPTMTLRESAVRMGALVSYQLRNPSSATVLCEARLPAPAPSQLTLLKGTSISVNLAAGNLIYELAANYIIEAGKTSPEDEILVVSPTAVGANSIKSSFTAVAGSAVIALADTTIDLSQLVANGQTVRYYDPALAANVDYVIQAITAADDSAISNQLELDRGWEGAAGSVEITVIEERVVLVQGQTFSENFSTGEVDAPNLILKLARSPTIQNSVAVSINGEAWTVVSALALEDADSQAVEVRILIDGSTAVYFGDGRFGALPPTDSLITVTYRVGGGLVGNVATGAVSATIAVVATDGSQLLAQLTNQTAAGEGGAELESLVEARNNIPAFIRANDRGVTLEDYETVVLAYNNPLYGQVKFARAAAKAENALVEPNIVSVYAWTTGATGGLVPLSTAMKRDLEAYLATKAVGTDYPRILDGTSRPAPISLRFKVFTGTDLAEAQAAVLASLLAAVNATKPGESIVFSNLVHELDSLPGVDSVQMATPVADLQASTASEIFTAPTDTAPYSYSITLTPLAGLTYSGQLGISPLQAWAFRAFLGDNELLVLPDATAGRARLLGIGVASYELGLLASRPVASNSNLNGFYYATDTHVIYKSDGSGWTAVLVGGSYVDLQTGAVVVSTTGTASTLRIQLVTSQPYENEREVGIYASYTGENTLAKRREVRAALRAWNSGFQIGASLFTAAQRNAAGLITLDTSRSNVTDTILSVAGVTGVNRVTFDSPANNNSRLNIASTDLIKISSIVLNNFAD